MLVYGSCMMLVSVRCPLRPLGLAWSPTPTGWCVGDGLHDLMCCGVHSDPAEHGAPRLPEVGVDCSACLSCGMVVLLVMTGCRLQVFSSTELFYLCVLV